MCNDILRPCSDNFLTAKGGEVEEAEEEVDRGRLFNLPVELGDHHHLHAVQIANRKLSLGSAHQVLSQVLALLI